MSTMGPAGRESAAPTLEGDAVVLETHAHLDALAQGASSDPLSQVRAITLLGLER